jgi:D-serine deaminase-like pyridoxal phosphate-dependent protein
MLSPEFIINTKIVKQNVDFMLEKAKKSNTIFRPHFKTHQSKEIGKIFLEKGVLQITVSSLKMANYFAEQGFTDITIAIPANLNQTEEINILANKISLNIILSNAEIYQDLLNKLDNKLGVFVEINTGYNRSGINCNNISEIDEIVKKIKNTNLQFKGFLSHFGNTYSAKSKTEILNIYNNSSEKLSDLKKKYIKYNPIISIGDTPSCSIIENFNEVDEIRPGNFVYYDLMQYSLGVCKLSEIGAFVKSTVITRYQERNELVIHTGAVHLSKEFIEFEGEKTYGKVIEVENNSIIQITENMNIISLSQEHGIIKCSSENFKKYNLYDEINILPVHSCLTANLMKDCSSYKS